MQENCFGWSVLPVQFGGVNLQISIARREQGLRGVMAVGQSRFLSGGGDIHALAFEYLRISIKIIQPTKYIAKGDRN